jgi:RNA polymerase sigma-70 factor (ECF subfamily)
MARFIDGDSRALEVLFDRHADGIRRFSNRLLLDASLAADVVQTTFLSVIRSRERFGRGSKVRPWLFAIAANACRDLRRRARIEARIDEEPPPEWLFAENVPRDPGLAKLIWEALDKLPEAQRETIIMSRFEGLSYAEIAEGTGLSRSAIKVRAHRGAQVLKRLLAGQWEP